MLRIGTDAFYRQVCENLGVALIATNLDFKIVTWNSAAARMFGAMADRMIGTPVVQIIPSEQRHLAERMLQRSLDTGETVQLQFQHRDGQGERRELTTVIAPVLCDAGDRLGLSVCVRDITRRIDMQTELHENRKMVALGEMAGAIAHHFNNILGGVITSVDFATSSGDPQLATRTLEGIVPTLQRAATLVHGMLTFAGSHEWTQDFSDLTELLNHIAEEVDRRSLVPHIDFTLSIPKLPVLEFARDPVMTILRNIVDNAIEAMPDGGSLRIEAVMEADFVCVGITDTGCGFDDVARTRIFEPFWSTKGALAVGGTAKATGLGLAAAHGLAQMLGGSISVTSKPECGSCFRLRLPLPKHN